MFVTNDKPTVFFDVDSTLVFTTQETPPWLLDPELISIAGRFFTVHPQHVEAIKDFAARGHNVIVWSQGGAAWAQTVVDRLQLRDYVIACLSKPNWHFDDKPVQEWMAEGTRSYLTPADRWRFA